MKKFIPRQSIYCLLLVIGVIFLCMGIPTQLPTNKKPIITVYIHGTRAIPHIVMKKLFHCTDGFHKASDIDPWFQQRKIANWISQADASHYPFENFYIFCWSGDLLPLARKKAAQKLYLHLKTIVHDYEKKYGSEPIIKLITHSHGGNVALNLVKQCNNTPEFFINELIVLACPVQEKTSHLTQSPLFKNIYSIYSTMDHIQWLDPQWLHRRSKTFFSERLFEPQANLKQIDIIIDTWGIFHINFLFETFNRLLPKIIDSMKALDHGGSTAESHYIIHLKSKE